ncbi:MAG: PQQ-binding-like beta-propeller repeat protein [Planctomycetaceae bacterium]|nr:PQQ-binding-like beta-propeller repeat protein [Planctomycetaceae bacterium]
MLRDQTGQRRRDDHRLVSTGMMFTLTIVVLGCGEAPHSSVAEERTPTETATTPVAAIPDVPPPDRDGSDWPQFLGPEGTGASSETNLLIEWPEDGPPLLWERELESGYAAPSIRGNRLILHHRVGDEEVVECMRADTGEMVWTYGYPTSYRDRYGYGNGPRCAPLLTDNRCYTFGAEGKLKCLELETGSPVWEKDVLAEFDVPQSFFGVAACPILDGDKLIVLVGGQTDSGIVAFDSATGEKLWESVGQKTWDGAETRVSSEPTYEWTGEEMVVSYSSPIAATIHGKRHVLALMRQGLVSVDPETGEENFHYYFRSRTHDSVNGARPVVVDDTIMLSAAYRVGASLLKVNEDGKSYEEVWSDPRNLMTHWSTAIHHDGHYYGFSGRHENEAELRCIDAATGDVVWKTSGWGRGFDAIERLPDGTLVDSETKEPIPFPVYGRGSAVLAEGRLIVFAERGTLALVEATSEGWNELARCSAPGMHYPCWAAPVLSRGRLYLLCDKGHTDGESARLICLDLKAKVE